MNIANDTVSVRLTPEPNNFMDCNAIIAEAYLAKGWTNIGTIPRRKIPKYTASMTNNELVAVKFAQSPNYGMDEQGQVGLVCSLIVIKNGPNWGHDDRTYSYNDDLP